MTEPRKLEVNQHEGRNLVTGTAVSIRGRGVLIIGASGSGKSALALQMMAYGAELIGDDRVVVRPSDGPARLCPPPVIGGRIEARGIGILDVPCSEANLTLVVDLDVVEIERLPEVRTIVVGDFEVPLLHKVESAHFPAAVWQYVLAQAP